LHQIEAKYVGRKVCSNFGDINNGREPSDKVFRGDCGVISVATSGTFEPYGAELSSKTASGSIMRFCARVEIFQNNCLELNVAPM